MWMHGCQVWDNFEPDWPQLGKNLELFKPRFQYILPSQSDLRMADI